MWLPSSLWLLPCCGLLSSVSSVVVLLFIVVATLTVDFLLMLSPCCLVWLLSLWSIILSMVVGDCWVTTLALLMAALAFSWLVGWLLIGGGGTLDRWWYMVVAPLAPLTVLRDPAARENENRTTA
jgi:hypothetical protein